MPDSRLDILRVRRAKIGEEARELLAESKKLLAIPNPGPETRASIAANETRVAGLLAESDQLEMEIKEEKESEERADAARKASVAAGTNPVGPSDSRGRSGHSVDGGPVWVRSNDMRPAVVERGQRFADHEVVADYARRSSERERSVIGQHGSLGNFVRSMSTTSGSAIVPTVWASDIIDRARNYAAVLRAGAQIVPMDAKVVQVGRLTTDPSAAFRTEGSTITASDPVFDNVTLTANTLSALVVGSIEWFQDAINVDEIVSEAIARAVALELDLNALYGGITTGSEVGATGFNRTLTAPPSPRGILAALLAVASSSVLGGQTNGTTQTATTPWNEILDTALTPMDFNEAPNGVIWSSRMARRYAEQYDTLNQPLRRPQALDAIPFYVSNQIPSNMTVGTSTTNMSDVFAGDFTQLLVGQRLDFHIQTLTERYAELGQVGIVATWRGDVQPARPRAFSVYRYLKNT